MCRVGGSPDLIINQSVLTLYAKHSRVKTHPELK
jgi:hypothetical protein